MSVKLFPDFSLLSTRVHPSKGCRSVAPSSSNWQWRRHGFCGHDGMGRHGVVGIATRCGLDGLEIESRWEREYPHPSVSALGPTQLPIQWVPDHFRGKAAGAWRWLPTQSNAEIKERVELDIYSTLCFHGLLQGELYLLWHKPFMLFIFEPESAIDICWWIELQNFEK